jgi:hypothetical protein
MKHIVKPKGEAMTDTPAPVSAEAPAPDLVGRLRERAALRYAAPCKYEQYQIVPRADIEDAAATITSLTAENERLTAENVRLGQWDVAADERIQLIKENERLTAALERAADALFDAGLTEAWAEARASCKEDRT